MSVLVFDRGNVCSPNLVRKTKETLTQAGFEIGSITGRYFYLVDVERELTDSEHARLLQVLDYPDGQSSAHSFVPQASVVPRLGTISPWSSKATDIVNLCQLRQIKRVERGLHWWLDPWDPSMTTYLHDRMIEQVVGRRELNTFFRESVPDTLKVISLCGDARGVLTRFNESAGLALSNDDITYLIDLYQQLGRDPTDAELMMFAQANSEHCRHKIFNAHWQVNGTKQSRSLFQSIRNTAEAINYSGLLSAYSDNAAVIEGQSHNRLSVDPEKFQYLNRAEASHLLMKVETHNHPTAIAPFPGAATGSGGEIRDEGSVGRGSKPRAGLTGFTTGHLRIPGHKQPWERETSLPPHLSSALQIMLKGPIGAASYNNEFGRPAISGYFRTFESKGPDGVDWCYHKPVMIAGGIGAVFADHIHAETLSTSGDIVVLGGPGMLIGLGGGAASSLASGSSTMELDFASVQRDNAEMQRRCQEVIDRCTYHGKENPIARIHDVGAGGLSNAIPELLRDLNCGGDINMDDVPIADSGMSPMAVWSNESQERYVMVIHHQMSDLVRDICRRERCPIAFIGKTNDTHRLVVHRANGTETVVDLLLEDVLGNPPQSVRSFTSQHRESEPLRLERATLAKTIESVLHFPSVASKKFLITIGDRSITAFVVQDQMVGPYQIPVADASVILDGFDGYSGATMAIGERSPLAVIDPAASARIAVGEALTNVSGVLIDNIRRIVLSANWMAAPDETGENQALFEAVRTIGEQFCSSLGIAIPVGKDSLSMKTVWESADQIRTAVAPLTLVVTAFAPVPDVRQVVVPMLKQSGTKLVLLSLDKQTRLGGSALAQINNQIGNDCPDVDDPERLLALFEMLQSLVREERILSIHDRSDGGLFVTCAEMAFAGRKGLNLEVPENHIEFLFNEEIGVVVEIQEDELDQLCIAANQARVEILMIGETQAELTYRISRGDDVLYESSIDTLEQTWSEVSFQMQQRRDDATCAEEENACITHRRRGLHESLTYEKNEYHRSAVAMATTKPKVAILRDQGINGQLEMAAAFIRAGFDAFDIHMSDFLREDKVNALQSLDQYQVLVACGGFSYGDVLGAGRGWANTIRFNEGVSQIFRRFFERDTLVLGVCNGCQMLSQLTDLIPGTSHWPRFERNRSDQFESRTVMVEVADVASPWLNKMQGSILMIPVAHGDGYTQFAEAGDYGTLIASNQIALRFVDDTGRYTEQYPDNPNGSKGGTAGLISEDGRVLAMMPHPERAFLEIQNSVKGDLRSEDESGAWMRLFHNACAAFN